MKLRLSHKHFVPGFLPHGNALKQPAGLKRSYNSA